jgi:hypothetical protein
MCKTHKQLFKVIPGWAQTGFPSAVALCCGAFDPAKKAQFMQKLGKIQHHLPKKGVKHDPKEVLEAMLYWKRKKLSKAQLNALFPQRPDKYISFEIDSGGFNNIRIGYEYVVLAAVITGRTLVLPPATGWYLIDWGLMGEMEDLKTHHHSFVQTGHVSEVHDFFDVKDMCELLNCITTYDFINKERARFAIPARHTAHSVKGSVNGDPKPWNDWLRTTPHTLWASWHPLNHVLYWPSKAAVVSTSSPEMQPMFSQGRGPTEMTEEEEACDILHFPVASRDRPGGKLAAGMPMDLDYRYLGQVAGIAAFPGGEHGRAMLQGVMQSLHDRVHYNSRVFDIASRVVR